MKKYLLLLLLLFVPFMVKAESDLVIEKIEFDSQSDLAEIVEDPTFEGKEIKLNVKFHQLNDFIRYKITLKNNTDKNYEITSETSLTEYINIGFEPLDPNDDILEANSTKTVYFLIKYANEVPIEKFENSSSITTEEVKSIELTVKENKVTVEKPNPYTKTTFSVIIAVIAVVSGTVVTILIKNKKAFKGFVVALIISILAIPITILALDKITIDVESRVEIKHPSFFIHFTDPESTQEFLFTNGMTWREFMNSDYYNEELGWEIVNYTEEHYYNPYNQGEEHHSFDYLPDDQEGISVGGFKVNCGNPYANQWIGSNYVIQTEDGYPSPDSKIINGYTYTHTLGAWC